MRGYHVSAYFGPCEVLARDAYFTLWESGVSGLTEFLVWYIASLVRVEEIAIDACCTEGERSVSLLAEWEREGLADRQIVQYKPAFAF